jgi:protein phosphatase 2C family protein 2/3
MEDEHIQIDDLSGHLGSLSMFSAPSAFYGVCAVTLVEVIAM